MSGYDQCIVSPVGRGNKNTKRPNASHASETTKIALCALINPHTDTTCFAYYILFQQSERICKPTIPYDDENPESYILPDPRQYYFLYHTLIQTDELWNPIIADGEDQESAISFTAPQFARLQALCEYLQRPLRNLQAPQDPAPAGDAQ